MRAITIKAFLRGAIPAERLKPVIDQCFQSIHKERSSLFSAQNRDWNVAAARQRIAAHRVSLSSDHAGVHALRFTLQILRELGIPIRNFGPSQQLLDRVGGLDHPTMVFPAIELLETDMSTRAILCCGSGTGVGLDASMLGFPAVKAISPINVVRGREHNNVQVLTIGETMVENKEVRVFDVIKSIILFLSTPFITDPSRYGDRIRLMRFLGELMPMARVAGVGSIAELGEFDRALASCPELADIYVVRAHEALTTGKLLIALDLINQYLKIGSGSKNYNAFLVSLLEMLREDSSEVPGKAEVIIKIERRLQENSVPLPT